MSLEDLVAELVEERSFDALDTLTGSFSEDVLEALIEAAGRILTDEGSDPADDQIVERIRQHLVDAKAVGLLVDALSWSQIEVREFALSVLSEIGDYTAVDPMIRLLEDRDPRVREAAASQLALMTSYDFGMDPKKWREWEARRVKGLAEQAIEDQEDRSRRLKLRMKGQIEAAKQASEDYP